MSRVLIGIGALIVLAGAVFAIVHFSSAPKNGSPAAQSSLEPQNGWVPVVNVAKPDRGPMQLAGTFGAWRLLCRSLDLGEGPAPSPGKVTSRCVVTLAMRRLKARNEWLNLRLASFGVGPGITATFAVLAYRRQQAEMPFVAPRGSQGKELDLIADKQTIRLYTRRCAKGGCFATNQISQPDLESILAARRLAVQLVPGSRAEADQVSLPTKGLKAAYAALRKREA